MDSLQNIFIKKLESKAGVKKNIDAVLICDAFNKSVVDLFGDAFSEKIKAISFKEGILKVGVTSSILSQEVQGNWGELVETESPIKRFVFETRKNLN